jgi:uncharacterized membrane protein YkvA (DUF1232 family)
MQAIGEVASDFPRAEFSALVHRLPRYARLAWVLARDPRLSRVRRAAVLAATGYVISPIDLVPGVIPVFGQLDDLLIALAAIRVALSGLNAQQRFDALSAAGLSDADLSADFRTGLSISAWLVRSGYRLAEDATVTAVSTGRRIASRALGIGAAIRHRDRGSSRDRQSPTWEAFDG